MMHGWLTGDRAGCVGARAWDEASSRTLALEEAVAARLAARHAIAVASPMVAFHLAYRAAGHALGATVLTTSLADPTVVRAAVASGYRLRFTDVDARGHLDDAALREHVAVHGAPAMIVASHHAGHPFDVAHLAARAPGALVMEDAIDALGAVAADGRPIGSPRHAALTVVGIHPVRASAPAQGAVLLTDDLTLAVRCRRVRDERAEHRLSELHAALALVELGRLGALVDLRARLATLYDVALAAQPLVTPVAPSPGTRSAWPSYLVRVPAWLRADVHDHLRTRGIAGRRLPMLLHRHPYFGRYADALPAELPATERLAAETLVLPTSTSLDDADVARATEVLAAIGTPDQQSGVALAG
jgi:dTDP-4-amino-4,6-dideoxygalactose transaminase